MHPAKNSDSVALCKLKNSKKYLTSNLTLPKKVGDRRPPVLKIQSPECSVNEKIPKFFNLKFSMTKKSWCPDIPCEKFKIHNVLSSKKFWKFFYLKFSVTKKVGAQTLPLKNSESRAHCKLKNSKKILTSNLVWPKKLVPRQPLWKIQGPDCSVNKKILNHFLP